MMGVVTACCCIADNELLCIWAVGCNVMTVVGHFIQSIGQNLQHTQSAMKGLRFSLLGLECQSTDTTLQWGDRFSLLFITQVAHTSTAAETEADCQVPEEVRQALVWLSKRGCHFRLVILPGFHACAG